MSVLSKTRCYLSGPIENDNNGLNWRVEPSKVLVEEFDIDLFDPFADPKQQWVPLLKEAKENKDYEQMSAIAHGFVRKDLCMVDRSDFIVAYLPKGVPTTGTHHEIITSSQAKKPTLLVSPHGKNEAPLWYFGFIPHSMIFGSWEELYEYLREINRNKHKDEDRWAFVYRLI